MALQLDGALHHLRRADHPSHPPSGHGVALGHPVHRRAPLRRLRRRRRQGSELRPPVDQVFVDLVGQHPHPPLRRPAPYLGQFPGAVHRPGRVGGRDEDQQLGAGRAGRLQLIGGRLEAALGAGLDRNRNPARQAHRLRVGDPVGGGYQHLVPRIHQALDAGVDGLFAAVGDDHLRGFHLPARIPPGFGGHRLPQGRQSGRRGVLVHGRVGRGRDRRLHDGGGGGEVGLARPVSDDRPPGGPQGVRLGGDGHGGRFRNSLDPVRYSCHEALREASGRTIPDGRI